VPAPPHGAELVRLHFNLEEGREVAQMPTKRKRTTSKKTPTKAAAKKGRS